MIKIAVLAKSANCNSFGLRGHILVADNGEAWEAAANSINELDVEKVVQSTADDVATALINLGFEIPRQLTDPRPSDLERFFPDSIWAAA